MKWAKVSDATKGVEFATEGEYTLFRVKTKGRFGPSKSGKTTIIGTTSGNPMLPNTEMSVNINVYTKEAPKTPPMKVRK
jgi:hypothetical protein